MKWFPWLQRRHWEKVLLFHFFLHENICGYLIEALDTTHLMRTRGTFHLRNGSAQDKTYNKTCATGEDSDLPAHPGSLIRAFADCVFLIRVHTHQGNVREIKNFSRSANCQRILWCIREKWNFAKMSGKCQGILHFSLMKLGCLVPMYRFC